VKDDDGGGGGGDVLNAVCKRCHAGKLSVLS